MDLDEWPLSATASAARWPSSWPGAAQTWRVVVGFHSGLATHRPAVAGDVKAGILVCIGADDPIVPPEQRAAFEQEMRAADVDWRMNVYGGAVHSFTNPSAGSARVVPGVAYHQLTDERSWRSMLDFFDERLGPA